ncbi:metal ABC transporter solute-binding protein, Zn/Mn family [Bifidobacterium leontopitheci]|uniref:Zinc-binding lipo protein n=1 Tax=Bifidobacterium leontopitheci TaxID=2650774 RepID=A0A6I1GEK4_9BIFI|nr:zinc ABC transporter substrate-binding protein [Bifidobacterium leontopitheci]KAB7790073.1 zinc-binding lipo protein [Bifidobacterium leontopitheci]
MNIHSHRIPRFVAAAATTVMLVLSAACGTSSNGEDEKKSEAVTGPITVVASVNQWGSLAEQIGGDDVQVTSILSSTGVDAHDFEPKTSDLAKLQKAQVVVSNGAGYDSWATKTLGRNAIGVSAAQTVGAMEGDNPHLWFSKDARNGMATELTEAFSKLLPAKKKAFQSRLRAWKTAEGKVEQAMDEFTKDHDGATYAATEPVVYYLMADMGFDDVTPKGYASSAAAEGEPAPADLQKFQSLIEAKDIDVLVNNTQEASDASNMLTGTAHRSDVPVFDVSEQLPDKYDSLTDWIAALVEELDAAMDKEDETDGDTTDDSANDNADGDGASSDNATSDDAQSGNTTSDDAATSSN